MNFPNEPPPARPRLRASAVCLENDHVLLVKLRDPVTGLERLFPPGGKVEEGESPARAALRETLEETGFRVRMNEGIEIVARYPFVWAGETYDCTTHFIGCRLDEPFREPRRVHDVSYNRGAIWVPRSDVSDALAFHREIREAVLRVLRDL